MLSGNNSPKITQILTMLGLVPTRARGAHPVGVREMQLSLSQEENIGATLWHPAAPTTLEKPLLYAKTLRGFGKFGASFATGLDRQAIVVVAHGLRGSRYDLAWLAEALASHGFCVVALEHPGASARSYDPQRAPRMWERARHLRLALDALEKSKELETLADVSRCIGVGHSAGAAALLNLARASALPERFQARFGLAGPVPPAEDADMRLQALIFLAPGTGRLYSEEALARVVCPTLLVSGGRDVNTPDAFNAGHYATYLRHNTWTSLPEAGHFSFRPVSTLYARLRGPALSREPGQVPRITTHQETRRLVEDFLRKNSLWPKAGKVKQA